MNQIARDLRYGWRQICATPVLAIVIVLSLALGVGANTAVFSLTEAVLLRNLPVQNPAQLVSLHWNGHQFFGASDMGPTQDVFSYPAFQRFQARATDFSSLFGSVGLGFSPQNTSVVVHGEPGLANGAMVTGEFFSGLGITPLLGRTLTAADQVTGAPPVAVISYSYWTRRFARAPAILGRTAQIDGLSYTIVGVTRPNFHGIFPGQQYDLWVPMLERPGLGPWGYAGDGHFLEAKDRIWMGLMGRLKPGITQAAAQAQLQAIWQTYMTEVVTPRPKPEAISRIELRNGAHGLNGLSDAATQPLLLMTILAALILLVACANVAALLLARATGRRREIGIRLALGAPRRRLIRQLLTESMLLAFISAALGLVFAEFGIRALAGQIAAMGLGITISASLDGSVLLFTAAVAIATGVLFGMLPALRATRVPLAGALNDRGATGGARLGAGRALIIGQVSVSLILLVVAGLLVRTLHNLETEDFGFPTANVLLFSVDPTQTGYTGTRLIHFYSALQAKLAQLPGVKAATLAMATPLSGGGNGSGARALGVPHQPATRFVRWNVGGPDYFRTNGIPLLMGRDLGPQDTAAAPHVAVVNQLMAQRFFPGENPIGRQFTLDGTWTIVGVMRNAEYGTPGSPMLAQAVMPFTQVSDFNTAMQVELRTYAAPEALLQEARQAVASLDASLPLGNVRTEAQEASDGVAGQRIFAWLAGFLGFMGLILAAIGLEGSMAYLVARRTPEIGIRMALGAGRSNILGMILRQALWMVSLGILIGVPIVFYASRYLASMLYGVPAHDPASFAAGIILLAVVGALAAWLPARRAARIDPLTALRCD